MAWVKLDEKFPDHPKVSAAGPLASWLYVCGVAYCNRMLTDGFIPAAQVRRLADVDNSDELAARLVTAGLWEETDDGFQIHDYLDYQPSRKHVEAIAQSRAEAGSKGGKQKSSNLLASCLPSATNMSLAKSKPVTVPYPLTTDPVADARARVTVGEARDDEAAPPTTEASDHHAEQRDKPPAYTRPFLVFWSAYPRKENKAEAWKAWNKLRPPPDLCDEIMTGLAHWQQSRQWTEGIYQHASTWLNRRQWEDEPEVAPTTPKERRNGRYPDRSTADAAPLNHGRFRPASARASPATSGVAAAPPPESGA